MTNVIVEQPVTRIIKLGNTKQVFLTEDNLRIVQITQQGLPGKDGEDTSVFTATVGVGGINQYQIVYIDSENTIKAANSSNITHVGRVAGITIESGLEGELVTIRTAGIIENGNWNLISGDKYLVGDGGEISNLIPISGFYQRIGVALNPTTLIIDIGEPVLIN